MKKLILIFVLMIGTVGFAQDIVVDNNKATKAECEQIIKTGDKELIARRGCCSWHGGVCDCNYGRIVCCDSTYSPSCTCKGGDQLPSDVVVR